MDNNSNKSTKISDITGSNADNEEYRPLSHFNDTITGELTTSETDKTENKIPSSIINEEVIIKEPECKIGYNPDNVKPHVSKVDPERLNKLSEIANKKIAKKSFMELTLFEISFGLYENINLIMSDLQTFFYMLSNGTASSKQFINIFIKDHRIIYVGITILLISFILFIIN